MRVGQPAGEGITGSMARGKIGFAGSNARSRLLSPLHAGKGGFQQQVWTADIVLTLRNAMFDRLGNVDGIQIAVRKGKRQLSKAKNTL
jgi:hypothetical protein